MNPSETAREIAEEVYSKNIQKFQEVNTEYAKRIESCTPLKVNSAEEYDRCLSRTQRQLFLFLSSFELATNNLEECIKTSNTQTDEDLNDCRLAYEGHINDYLNSTQKKFE